MAAEGVLSDGTPAPERALPAAIHYGFETGSWRFLIPLSAQPELIALPRVTPIPDTPELLRGFINHQGHTLPVFDLALLQQKSPSERGRWALLLGQRNQRFGLVLSRFPRGLNDARVVDAPLPRELSALASGISESDGQRWYWLDPDRFARAVRKLLEEQDAAQDGTCAPQGENQP